MFTMYKTFMWERVRCEDILFEPPIFKISDLMYTSEKYVM